MAVGIAHAETARVLAERREPVRLDVPARAREARLRVGVVPQVGNLDPDFSVRENLLVYGRYFGLPAGEVRRPVASGGIHGDPA